MAKINRFWPIVLSVWLLFVIGCNGSTTTLTPQSPTPSSAVLLPLEPESSLNLLISTSGPVLLNRVGWSNNVSVSLGTAIRRGDLIRPAAGASAQILCSDLSLHTVAEESGTPCRVKKAILTYKDISILSPRAPGAKVPIILHPRNTAVLDAHPWLQWQDTGANSYRVAVIQGGSPIWQQEGVVGSEIRYPDEVPALQAGVDYLLEITDEDSNRSSGEDPARGLGFRLLTPENEAQVMAQSEAILALPLDEDARDFALAVYYAGQGVPGEALALLDDLTPTADAPAVPLWRGNLLLTMHLAEEAAVAYRNALTKATTLGDIETQALAQVGLWHATGDSTYYDQAIMLYEGLGDATAVAALKAEK